MLKLHFSVTSNWLLCDTTFLSKEQDGNDFLDPVDCLVDKKHFKNPIESCIVLYGMIVVSIAKTVKQQMNKKKYTVLIYLLPGQSGPLTRGIKT